MIKLSKLVNELKLTDDMRIHMSKKPFELEPRTFTQTVTVKPSGFWYGFGSEWIDWTRNEMPEWTGKYIYDIDTGNTNVLQIKTNVEMLQFNSEYKADVYMKDAGEAIDWKKVASKYGGIEINPYQYDDARLLWYYGWDIACGCVWNLSRVKLKLLTDTGIE